MPLTTTNFKIPGITLQTLLGGVLLVLGVLGEIVSGYATDIGVQSYFFPQPWSLGMTAFIQGSIIFSAVALKFAISRQAFSESWRLPFVGLLLLSFSVSVSLSSVGAYKEFGYKFTQKSDLLTQEKSDFAVNWKGLEDVRQTDVALLNKKIGELNRQKVTQDSASRSSHLNPQARNAATVKRSQLASQIKEFEALSSELEKVSLYSFDETTNQTAGDSVADVRDQKQKLQHARQTISNLHSRLPEELRRDREFPEWQASNASTTNEQSAFIADLRAGKTPALTAVAFGLFLDLMCVLCAFAGVSFPSVADRIRRTRAWCRNVRASFSAGVSTIEFASRERGGLRVAANFNSDPEDLRGSDIDQARAGLERVFSHRFNDTVTIRAFLNSDGAVILSDRALLPQLGEEQLAYVVFNEDDDAIFENIGEVSGV